MPHLVLVSANTENQNKRKNLSASYKKKSTELLSPMMTSIQKAVTMESLRINLPRTEVLDFLGFQQAVCTSLLVWKYRLSAMMEGDLELG